MFSAPHPQALHGCLVPLANGVRGVNATLAAMRRLVKQGKTQMPMLTASRHLVFMTPAKDEFAEADAVFQYVRDTIRYTRDVYGVETLSTPDKTLQTRVGDCDDKTTLLATMLECVGFPTRFVVTGYEQPGCFQHVYLQVWIQGQWIDADSTEPYELGYAPPAPVAQMIERI